MKKIRKDWHCLECKNFDYLEDDDESVDFFCNLLMNEFEEDYDLDKCPQFINKRN